MLGTVIQEKTSISATFPNCALYVSLYSSCVVPPLASAQTQHAFPIVKESPQAAGLSYFLIPFPCDCRNAAYRVGRTSNNYSVTMSLVELQ